jgi:lipopolysaccharide export LptBFGC system permease protein LptF
MSRFLVALFLGLVLGAIAMGFVVNQCHNKREEKNRQKYERSLQEANTEWLATLTELQIPDTVYTDSIVYIEKVEPNKAEKPILTQVAMKPDTALRSHFERSTGLLALERKNGILSIETISPIGKVTVKKLPAEILTQNFRIDSLAQVQVLEPEMESVPKPKGKFLKGLGKVGQGFVAGVIVTVTYIIIKKD